MEEVAAAKRREEAKLDRLEELAEEREAVKLTFDGPQDEQQSLIEEASKTASKPCVITLFKEDPVPSPEPDREARRSASPNQEAGYDSYERTRQMSFPYDSAEEDQGELVVGPYRRPDYHQMAMDALNRSHLLDSSESDHEERDIVEDSQEALERAQEQMRMDGEQDDSQSEAPAEVPKRKRQRTKAQAHVKLANPSEIPQLAGGGAPAAAQVGPAPQADGQGGPVPPAAAQGVPAQPPDGQGAPAPPPDGQGGPVPPAAGGVGPVPPDPNAGAAGGDMSALYANGAPLEPDLGGFLPNNFDKGTVFKCGDSSKSLFDLFKGSFFFERKVSKEEWPCQDSAQMPLHELATTYEIWIDIDAAFPGRTEELDHPGWFSLVVKKCKISVFAGEQKDHWQVNYWKIKPDTGKITFFFKCASYKTPRWTHDILVVDNRQRTLPDINSDWLFVKLIRQLEDED